MKIQAKEFSGENQNYIYDKQPNKCPYCCKRIMPIIIQGVKLYKNLAIFYQCTDNKCKEIFIVYYINKNIGERNIEYKLSHTSLGKIKEKEFSNDINDISNNFVDIYNQSIKAEKLGLDHICGMGYRKALEFLIKDYLIKLNPEKKIILKINF